MLKVSDFVRTFPIHLKTDRDCETPMLVEWASKKSPIGSLLDIGAHWSGHHYAPGLRGLVNHYDGIDIQSPDDVTKALLNGYFVGNANDYHFEREYDAVICVSTIEHAGVSTYKGDYLKERMALFQKCLDLARKHVWISMPVGQEHVEEGEFAVITEPHFNKFLELAKAFKVRQRFFYSQGPQANHPWQQHAKRGVAFKIPYLSFEGNKSIAVLEIDK